MLLPIGALLIPLTLLALLRWAARPRRDGEPFVRFVAVVAGRLMAVRLPLLWARCSPCGGRTGGQIAGYLILVVNFLPEFALAGWWKRLGGPHGVYALTSTAIATSLVLAAGWAGVAAARARRRAAA